MDINKIILFSDEDYFAVNKPAGISVLEDRNSEENLLGIARNAYPQARVCHRIDMDTTGVLVFSRHDAAYRHLSLAFQDRKVCKVYHALIHGVPEFLEKEVNLTLHTGGSGKVRTDKHAGKPAKTCIKVLEKFRSHAFIECRPVTGRRHQIRVHLQSLGHPIVGDQLYGGGALMLSDFKRGFKMKSDPERPLIDRPALHAFSLSFTNMQDSAIDLRASYPKDFRVALHQLRKVEGRIF